MAPILKEVKEKLGDAVTIIKVDVDRNPQAAQAYQVQGVPTLVLFKKGEVRWRRSGVVPAGQLEQVLRQQVQELVAQPEQLVQQKQRCYQFQ